MLEYPQKHKILALIIQSLHSFGKPGKRIKAVKIHYDMGAISRKPNKLKIKFKVGSSETIREEEKTLNTRMNITAQWIIGFTDGEGCFHIGINKNSSMNLKYQILPEFTVVQHQRDIKVLYALKAFFQCGVVRKNHGNVLSYRVRGQKNLSIKIIPFFEKHRLKTSKRIDFYNFRKVIRMIDREEHLTVEGLEQIKKIQELVSSRKKL